MPDNIAESSLLSNLFTIFFVFIIWSLVSKGIFGIDRWFGRMVWLVGSLFIMFAGVLVVLIWAGAQGLSLLQ